MGALLYFAIWTVLFFILMRLLCGAYVTGQGHISSSRRDSVSPNENDDLRWVAPKRAKDPVCHKQIATESAKPTVYDGDVYYFCSRECREIFEAAPDLYVGGKSPPTRRLEHSHV